MKRGERARARGLAAPAPAPPAEAAVPRAPLPPERRCPSSANPRAFSTWAVKRGVSGRRVRR
jgi:hypothetical protein